MSEPAERVVVACPACAPDGEAVHEVLKPGGQATVRCTECGHVHKTAVGHEREVTLDTIVSQGGESYSTTVDVPAEEELAEGDEFIVETPEAIQQVRVTSLDLGGDRRVDSATAADVSTVWTRVVDNVSVNVTVHPGEDDGREDESRSLTLYVPGDYEFTVGETESFGDEEFSIEGVHVRDDAPEYRFDKMDHDGDSVFAKDAKRVYGRDETTSAWSAW